MDSTLRTAVASGMGAVIGGEPMEPAHALAALAATPHLLCHSAFFIERLGVAAQAPRAAVRAASISVPMNSTGAIRPCRNDSAIAG